MGGGAGTSACWAAGSGEKPALLSFIAGRGGGEGGEDQRPAHPGLRVATVEQEPLLPEAPTLRESLALRGKFSAIHDERTRWRTEARLVEFLHRFGVGAEIVPAEASGGERKRAALALGFALQPDLLLLDEPTNHLDIDGITLLEAALLKGGASAASASIIVTHDRYLLERVATRIIELDRGALRSYPGNYSTYERLKAGQLADEAVANRRFDKFWAQEEVWIRKGVEARRTRNEGRLRRLERLRGERAARRERVGSVRLSIDAGERSGKLVAELEHVTKAFGERLIVKGLSMRIGRGDRIGMIGANGAGKSTLIKLILGTLAPDAGRVRLGTSVTVAYFDQLREQLDPERSVADTVSEGSDWVEAGGAPRHVLSYLGDFLFPPRRANSPVKMLSGGERNRLLLARLFARPANVLVLDEPTNDLDIESLELLEQTLQDYTGTLLLVSHDRAFLDNVVTQTLASEGGGLWREYVGGYSDWLAQRPAPNVTAVEPRTSKKPEEAVPSASAQRRAKLSYKEQRELASVPGDIEALEAEQRALAERTSEAGYYTQDARKIKQDQLRAQEIEALLLEKLERWEALEAKTGAG